MDVAEQIQFQQFIHELQLIAANKQKNEAEVVSEEDAVIALNILNFALCKNLADIFRACACLNLLNTYVKQSGSRLNYEFRRHISKVLRVATEIHDNNLFIVVQQSEKFQTNILMFEFFGFQFSFKGESQREILKRSPKKNLSWDGIRKQKCANTIFQYSYKNQFVTNFTEAGERLDVFLAKESSLFRTGMYRFINGKLIRDCAGIGYDGFENRKEVSLDSGNKNHLVNYVRIRLLEHKDRPSLFSGKLVRIWSKHVTFIHIRPVIGSVQTSVVCDHINILRTAIEKYMQLDTSCLGRKYYLLAYSRQYSSGVGRFGLELAEDLKGYPIVRMNEFAKISKDDLDRCFRFNIQETGWLIDGPCRL